jgi:hypothetical protein
MNGGASIETYYATSSNQYAVGTIGSGGSQVGDDLISAHDYLPTASDIQNNVNATTNGFFGATIRIQTTVTTEIWYKLVATIEYFEDQ